MFEIVVCIRSSPTYRAVGSKIASLLRNRHESNRAHSTTLKFWLTRDGLKGLEAHRRPCSASRNGHDATFISNDDWPSVKLVAATDVITD